LFGKTAKRGRPGTLRRNRKLAFDGAEDLTPSGFYAIDEAAREIARRTVAAVAPPVQPDG